MEEGSIAVLVDAKEEYTKQLISVLKPCIYQGVKSIYLDAKDICNQDNTPEKVLMVFQDLLSRIPKWSQDIINKEFERIVSISKCDYIEDLLKVIYVSHIKVLTIVHSAQKNKKLSLKVPNGGHFIHLCYIECAREFWKDPYLFSENANKYELQKNMRDSESMISECIAETIRKQLPVRHILKEFLNEPDEEIEEADDDVREPVNKKYMKKLESVVKKELKTNGKSSAVGGSEIDIDLIRKVIREELNTRPQQQNDIIKKELVETVVEKIVEQAAEVGVESNENKISETVANIAEVSSEKELTSIPASSSSIDNHKSIENTKDTENQANLNTNINLANTSIENVKSESASSNSVEKIDKDTTKENADTIELESDNVSANNLESLLDELPVRTPSENKVASADDEIVLEGGDNNQGDKDNDTKNAKQKDNVTLRINDVDEINLNLDEFDDDEITFGEPELEEIDIKSNAANATTNATTNANKNRASTETKKENTKYIFFNE
jgi:hypothetical protein